ncbi:MAG TPA: phosphate ABC transporter substrate-binding protein PstS [Draconibacterium sp.]|nr:phosphate ABC transporter substrate-binding protein PstS [Draconibacterium sp.]
MKQLAIVILAVVLLQACSGTSNKKADEKSANISNVSLTAAGATFPMPYYNMVFKTYGDKTGTQITYGGIGSGGGIRSLTDKVVDFGATDAYLDDAQMAEMPAEIVHIPTVLGAVVIAYNLEGVDGLKLSSELLEKIFMGEITKWNDSKIKSINPDLNLPDLAITVIVRSDGSGTTHIFSDYMSKISSKWADKVGTGKSLQWPVGMGAKGNPGVAGTISQTRGAVGYIGSEYAFAMKIQTAQLQNSSGNFVLPTIETVSAAAQGEIPADTRIMLTNSADPNSYPISGFTWIILYKEQNYNNRTKEQALATVKLLDWLVSEEAQGEAEKVHYAPLPASAVEKAKSILRGVTFDGNPLI